MKILFAATFVASSVLAFAGCATILYPKMAGITVSVAPDSSMVYANGNFMGYSPVRFEVDRRETQMLEVKHAGYGSQTRILKTTIHPLWITSDILLTAGLGAIIDATTGAWNKVEPDVIIMDLTKLD